ncbi:MAG: rod shape-determining protein MreD [Pseudomonadota bacterium]
MNPAQGGWVIMLSLIVAMILMVLRLPEFMPDLGLLRPQWLLMVVFFWVVETPHRLGLVVAWLLGLLTDVLLAHPLGLNAFILAGTTWVGWVFYERLRMYSVFQQCAVLFVIVLLAEACELFALSLMGRVGLSWELLTTPAVSMFVWPFLYVLLTRLRIAARVA